MNHPADIPHFREIDRAEAAESAAREYGDRIYRELLTTGSNDVDDERVGIHINVTDLRRANALRNAGSFDAALTVFADAFDAACGAAATEEAGA